MASDTAAAGQGRSARRAKKPVDIELEAGMRPMLIRHGIQRQTQRHLVRETTTAVQYVAITPPDRREGYLTCLYDVSAGITIKQL